MTSAPVTLVVKHNTDGTDLELSHSAENLGEFEADLLTFKPVSCLIAASHQFVESAVGDRPGSDTHFIARYQSLLAEALLVPGGRR